MPDFSMAHIGELAKTIGEILGAVVAGGGAIILVWRRAIRPTVRLVVKIDKAVQELLPNGGGSLRDSVNRIEKETTAQSLTLLEQKRSLLQHGRRIDHIGQLQWAMTMDARFGIFETDSMGDVIRVNQTFCRIVGRSQEDCLGNNWVICIDERDRDGVMAEWNSAIKYRRNFEKIFNMRHSDGHRFLVLCKARLIYGTFPGGTSSISAAQDGIGGWIANFTKIGAEGADLLPKRDKREES